MKRSLNERFTDLVDRVSEYMGKWWVTTISVVLILLWLACGPFFHFSDTWQLIVNTPTTIIELWIGFLLAAAANRVERRNKQTTERDLQTDTRAERRLLAMQAQLDRIEEKLDVRQSRAKGKGA